MARIARHTKMKALANRADNPNDLTLAQLQKVNYSCTDRVVSDLKYSFMRDFTIERACRYAKITPDTYYRWVNQSYEFAQLMALSQDFMLNQAQAVIEDAIEKGDKEAAKWILERRDKARFSLRNELTGTDGAALFAPVADLPDDSEYKQFLAAKKGGGIDPIVSESE